MNTGLELKNDVSNSIQNNGLSIVMILGAFNHGKLTPKEAIEIILEKLAESGDSLRIENEIKNKDSEISYQIAGKYYNCLDFPTYIKGLLSSKIIHNGAILVAVSTENIEVEVRKQIFLAQLLGIQHLFIFINKVDIVDDEVLIDSVEKKVRNFLKTSKFSDDNIKIIKALNGDLLYQKKIREVLATVNQFITSLETIIKRPFYMEIENIRQIDNGRSEVSGKISRGEVFKEKFVELIDSERKKYEVQIDELQSISGNTSFDYVPTGNAVKIILKNEKPSDIDNLIIEEREGQYRWILSEIGSFLIAKTFKAVVYIQEIEEGGEDDSILNNSKLLFSFPTEKRNGTVQFVNKEKMSNPKKQVAIQVELDNYAALEYGMMFCFYEGEKYVGYGVVAF